MQTSNRGRPGRRPSGRSLKLVRVHTGTVGTDQRLLDELEFVQIWNVSGKPARIAFWTIVHMDPQLLHLHTFKFPAAFKGDLDWQLEPNATVLVLSGAELTEPTKMKEADRSPKYLFDWGLGEPIWINSADLIALRDDYGNVVEHHVLSSVLDIEEKMEGS